MIKEEKSYLTFTLILLVVETVVWCVVVTLMNRS